MARGAKGAPREKLAKAAGYRSDAEIARPSSRSSAKSSSGSCSSRWPSSLQAFPSTTTAFAAVARRVRPTHPQPARPTYVMTQPANQTDVASPTRRKAGVCGHPGTAADGGGFFGITPGAASLAAGRQHPLRSGQAPTVSPSTPQRWRRSMTRSTLNPSVNLARRRCLIRATMNPQQSW